MGSGDGLWEGGGGALEMLSGKKDGMLEHHGGRRVVQLGFDG